MSTTEEDLQERLNTLVPEAPELNDFQQSYQRSAMQDRLELYGQYTQEDFDRSARILRVAGQTGIPHDIIAGGNSLESLEQQIKQPDFDANQWLEDSPIFAKYASENPYALVVLKQDSENLSWIEREWGRPMSLAFQSTKAKVELNQIWNRRAMGVEYHQDGDMERVGELQKMVQEHDFGAENWWSLSAPFIWGTREIGPMAYITWEGKEGAMMGAMAGAGLAMVYGQTGPQLLAPEELLTVPFGFFTGGGIGWSADSAGASFEMMRGEQYGRYIQAGFDHQEAAKVSTLTGAISTLPELSGVGKLIKHIPGVDKAFEWTGKQVADRLARDILVRQSYRRAAGQLAMRYGQNMAWEIGTEIFQDSVATVGQNYLASSTGRPEAAVTWDQYVDDVAHTAIMTAKGVMLIGAVGPGSSFVRDYKRARDARGLEDAMTALAERLTDSKIRTEAPEQYRDFVEEVAAAHGGGPRINANRWDEFWQSNNEDPDAMADRFGIDRDDMELAREVDMDIAIPPVPFAEQLAPSELFNGIVPHLKWTEDGMSPHERDLFNANKPEAIRKIEESIEKLSEAESKVDAMNLIEEVTGELMAADFDPTAAQQMSQIYRGFGVIADKLDMDAQELFDKFYGGVRRVTPEALQRTKILDPHIDPIINRLRRQDWPTARQQRGDSLMDLVREMGGLDPTDPELSAMDFELGSLDLGITKADMQRWKESGRLVSEIAETAAERGYIPEYDENLLLAAISRELGGDPVFGARDDGMPGMRETAEHMERLERMIQNLDIDLENMSNEEVRAALEAADTYDQELAGDELRSIVEQLVRADELAGGTKDRTPANEIDNVLNRWGTLAPLIYADQDFGDLQITDTVELETTGEQVEITEDAREKLERVQRRQKALKALLECVSG
jgi:archaellum component FlaC